MISILYRVLCLTAHWQYLKFKNHCSLLVIQADFSVLIEVGKATHHPAVPWDLPAGRAADPGRPRLLLCGDGGTAPGGDRPPHHLSPALPTRWINFFGLCTTLKRNFDLCFPIYETAGLIPYTYSHIFVSDLYIARIGLAIWLQQNRQTNPGNI